MTRLTPIARVHRWGSLSLTLALAALQFASLPFYAGSTVGSRLGWRLEHGRLTVRCAPALNPEDFYIAFNSEGLKWAWDARISSVGDWMVCVPLWTPLVLSLVGCMGMATAA